MKHNIYILSIIVSLLVIYACDSPTDVEDNIKKTALETNYSESSGLLIELDTTQIPEPVKDSIIEYDTTNFKGNNTGIMEFYSHNGSYYSWERNVFWFDAFKIILDTLNNKLKLDIDIKTNNLQKYYRYPPDRISKFQVQIENLNYSEEILDMPLNSQLGGGKWSSYTIQSVVVSDTSQVPSITKTLSGRESQALFRCKPQFDMISGDIKGLLISFDIIEDLISEDIPYPFEFTYQMTIHF